MKTLIACLFFSIFATAQTNVAVQMVSVAPSGACSNYAQMQQVVGGGLYQCTNGTWASVTASGSTSISGAVTGTLASSVLNAIGPYYTQYITNLMGQKQPISGQLPTITRSASSIIAANPTLYPMVVSGAPDTAHFLYPGTKPGLASVFGIPGNAVVGLQADELYNPGLINIEFYADSRQVQILQQGNGQSARILVDGLEVLSEGGAVLTGTATSGSSTSITLASGALTTNGIYNAQWAIITGGTGAGQSRQITGYVGGTLVATVSPAWTTTPDNTSTYTVSPTNYVLSGLPLDGNQYYTLLTFPSRAMRKIRVETAVNIYGVYVDQSGVITKPIPTYPVRAFVIGDSFEEGTTIIGSQSWGALLCEMMGWDHWNYGFGGTGYISQNNGARKNYLDRSAPAVNSWILNAAVTGTGTFTLTQNGVSTSAIATNASQATVQAAVDAAFGSGNFFVYPSQYYFWVLCGRGTYGAQTYHPDSIPW